MRRKFLLMTFLTLLFIAMGTSALLAQDNVVTIDGTVGGYSAANSTNVPIWNNEDYSISQQYYLADEIGKTDGGKITSVAFQADEEAVFYIPRQIMIYMVNTSVGSIAYSSREIKLLDNTSKVFEGEVLFSGNAWNSITLDTPFEYSGGNILLCVVDNTGSSETNSNDYVADNFNCFSDRGGDGCYRSFYAGNHSGTEYDATSSSIAINSIKGSANVPCVQFTFEPEVVDVAKIGTNGYTTFADALAAAATMTGDVTVEIYEKVTLNQSLSGSYSSINFVGKDTDAEIYLDVQGYITATGKNVAFQDLTLSKSEGGFITNAGFMNVAFGVFDVAEVTYTNCTFANGAYAATNNVTFTGCTFYRSHDKYGLWAYGDSNTVVDNCTFADYRGIKMYAEGAAKTVDLTVKDTDFSAVDSKPAIVLTYGESVTLENNIYSSTGTFELDLDGAPNGTAVTSDVAPTCVNDNGACGVLVDGKIYTTVAQAAEVATEGSTVTLLHNSTETVEFVEGVELNKNGFTADNVTVDTPAKNIEVTDAEGNVTYLENTRGFETSNVTLKLLANVGDYNLNLNKLTGVVLDLNGYTFGKQINLNNGAELTIKDSSTEKTGKVIVDKETNDTYAAVIIMRGTLTIEGGTIETTGTTGAIQASLATLNIEGGKIVSQGNGIELGTWAVSNEKYPNTFTMTDGEIVAEGVGIKDSEKCVGTTISIKGGKINSKDACLDVNTGEAAVSGGTFSTDVTAYCAEGFVCEQNADGTYGVGEILPVKIGEVSYQSLEAAAQAAQAGDEIILLADVDVAEELKLPAGIILNGNGKQINGSIVAAGNLTFVGHTKVTSFNAGSSKPVITIGKGACLEMNGTGRMVIGHGATFNITGNIDDAKTADVAELTPSLIMAGASFTGAGVTFNVTNAYIKATAYCSSKNKNANGTFDFNIENSIWDQTGSLQFSEPTEGMDPTVNFELSNSVLTTTSHLIFAVSKGEIVFDNSNVNVATSRQIENRSTMTVKNGSVVNGAVATSSNAKNPGTLIVDNATYAVTGEFSGSDLGTGTLVVKNGATFSAGKITKANIQIDATGMTAGYDVNITADLSKLAGTIEVINNDKLEAEIVDGKIVLVAKPAAKIGEVKYATLEAAVAAATSGQTITLLRDVELSSGITVNKADAAITIEGNGNKIVPAEDATFTGLIFTVRTDLTLSGVTIEGFTTTSDIVNVYKGADLTLTNCALSKNNGRSIVCSQSGYENIVTITGTTFTENISSRDVVYCGDGTGKYTIDKCDFVGNVDSGTALIALPGTVSLTNSTIKDNKVTVQTETYVAGAAYCWGADVKITGNTIENNIVETNSAKTAAVIVKTGDKNIDLSNNTIEAEKAIYVRDSGTGVVTITSGTINGTITSANGAGIAISGGTFSTDVTAYCAEGFGLTQQADGSYIVVELPSSTLTNAYTSATTYWGECSANAKESFVFKFYNDDTYMGYTSLNNVGGIIDGDVLVSWHIRLDAENNTDEYWTMAWEIQPTVAMQPNRVEHWVDGKNVKSVAVEPNWSDRIFPVVAAITDDNGVILSYVNGKEGATLADAFAKDANITILRDITLTEGIVIPAEKTVVLDLNGKTISQEKECTAHYEMIKNEGNLTITGKGKISFKDTSAGDPNFGWGSYTIANYGTLVVKNGTIEHLGEQAFATHMICAIQQFAGTTTVEDGTISTPAYRSVRLWKGEMIINGGTFDGQFWVQSTDDSAKLTITDGAFSPNGGDGSSVFVGNVTTTGVHHTVEFSVTGGTFETKIGCNDAEKLTGGLITGGNFSASAVENTNKALLAEGFVFAGEANDEGYYTVVDDPKTEYISTLEGLMAFRDAVNAGNNFSGVTVYLTADIDLAAVATRSESNWTPIGTEDAPFKGTFDGQDHTISNLKINDADLEYAGLFGYATGAKINNVKIHNVDIYAYSHVGAVVGSLYTGSATNCHVSGTISLVSQYAYAGGITGYGYNNIYNCSVIAEETGIVKVEEKSGAAGIVGWHTEGNLGIYNCTVKNLDITAYTNIGGITGFVHYENTIDGCVVDDVNLYKTRENGQASIGLAAGGWSNKSDGDYIINITNNSFDNMSINAQAITSLNQLYGSNYYYYDVEIKLNEEGNTYGNIETNFEIVASNEGDFEKSVAYVKDGETIKVGADFELTKIITVPAGKTIVLDLNGKTITGKDNTESNFSIIDNRGTLTITDSSSEKSGKMTVEATVDSGWNRYSAVIANNPGGNLTIEAGTIEHLGGTSMAYGIDNLTNGKGTSAVTTINGGTVSSKYIAIRQFLNGVEATNKLTIKGGTINGDNSSIYFQSPSAQANTGELVITSETPIINKRIYCGITEGATEWPVVISVDATALADGVTFVTDEIPAGYELKEENGVWGVRTVEAQIGDVKYATLKEAVEAANEGETVTLIANVELENTITIAAGKEVVLDLNGKVVSGTCNSGESHMIMVQNTADLTIKDSSENADGKLTFAQGTSNTGWVIDLEGDLTLESGTIELTGDSWSIGYAVDVRPNSWGSEYTEATTFTMKGGKLVSSDGAVRVASSSVATHENVSANFVMNGGEIEAAWDGIFVQQSDAAYDILNVKINDGKIASAFSPFRLYSTYVAASVLNNVENPITLNITGGTFDYTGDDLDLANEKWIVPGVIKFGGNVTADDMLEYTNFEITGGTFDGDVNAYCAEGFGTVANTDGTYSVVQSIFTQTRTLAAGWNWFSSYINLEGAEGLETLETALGTSAVQVKSKTQFDVYNETSGWGGTLNEYSVEQMYMINTTSAHTLTIAGELVDKDQIITLHENWNWIAYPISENISVATALSNVPVAGDQIKSKGAFAIYDGTQWAGTLLTLEAGQGYMYLNQSGDVKTFQYAYPTEGTRTSVKANITAENNYWVPNVHKYANNMTMVATLDVEDENYEVAAFVNGECRGSARPIYVEALDAYMLFLTISGDDVEEMSFRYYDIDTDTEYEISDRMNYSNDATVGTLNEPYVLNRATTGIDEVSLSNFNIYPNPTTTNSAISFQTTLDKVEVYNSLGAKIAEYQNVDSIDALETAGIYVIRVTNNGDVKHCRVVVK